MNRSKIQTRRSMKTMEQYAQMYSARNVHMYSARKDGRIKNRRAISTSRKKKRIFLNLLWFIVPYASFTIYIFTYKLSPTMQQIEATNHFISAVNSTYKNLPNDNSDEKLKAKINTTSITSIPVIKTITNKDLEYPDRIPHRLIFLDTRYDSIDNIPSPFKNNVKHTIEVYDTFWNNNEQNDNVNNTIGNYTTNTGNYSNNNDTHHVDVEYLGDAECQNAILIAEETLLRHYIREKKGKNKSNICRIAILYLKGGYYFDTDMEAVKPVKIQSNVTFVTPVEAATDWHGVKGLFNSFIAVSPKHPLLRINLNIFIKYYKWNIYIREWEFPLLGTASLFASYKQFISHKNSTRYGNVKNDEVNELLIFDKDDWLLDLSLNEMRLSSIEYPLFPRHKGRGWGCDYVVQNATEKEIYFYSRIVGTDGCYK